MKLLYEIEIGQITYEETLKRIENIHSDINKIINMQSSNLNQHKFINILFMVSEIFSGKSKSVEANKEGSFEIFEENQTKKNKNPLKNQIRKICLN